MAESQYSLTTSKKDVRCYLCDKVIKAGQSHYKLSRRKYNSKDKRKSIFVTNKYVICKDCK
ncbi:hypothetical protein [Clostridium intestinale]|uniref:Uncharacterized protein n=1 Tax=Clostridium intestinale TaxID=36845 RepID=A0A7D6ZE22_9CLOT|nr:hypothetical protein [Clostridium intestinale]QLY77821.1 hypothetical protein HZF06_11935 [Clostridium intestinale]